MSTHWGYVCMSHDPHLSSEHWFNHGEDVLRMVWEMMKAGTWPKVPDEFSPEDWAYAPVVQRSYETMSPVYWLLEHPHCDVGMENEYGEVVPLGTTITITPNISAFTKALPRPDRTPVA